MSSSNEMGDHRVFRRLKHDNGGVAAAIILLPLLLVLMELIIFTGRVSGASADLNAAASEGARAGSLVARASQVAGAAEPAALAVLQQRGVPCSDARVVPSAESQLNAGGVVAIEVFCTIKVSDLGFLTGLTPIGDFELRGLAFEGIDPLRVFGADS